MASSHREPWLAGNEGGRQRLRAKTNCECGFVKSSVDAKCDTLDMHTKQRLQSTAHICWEREAEMVAVGTVAEDWTG